MCDCQIYENCAECTPLPELARIRAAHDAVVRQQVIPAKTAIVISLPELAALQKEYISTLAPRDRLETQLRFLMFLTWLRKRQEEMNAR